MAEEKNKETKEQKDESTEEQNSEEGQAQSAAAQAGGGKEEKSDSSANGEESEQDASADEGGDDGTPSDDTAEEEVEIDPKFEEFISKIEELSVSDLVGLVKAIEAKFGISAAAPAAAGPAAGGDEEKDEFDVVLSAAGDQKLNVIKAVRQVVPDLGLKEAKELVESAPKAIKEGLKKEEAEEIKATLEEAGATVELK